MALREIEKVMTRRRQPLTGALDVAVESLAERDARVAAEREAFRERVEGFERYEAERRQTRARLAQATRVTPTQGT
jgi:hypothetical protein